ncbi:hypothetical protein JCM3774_006088 [Rhodotorula dairenensis]
MRLTMTYHTSNPSAGRRASSSSPNRASPEPHPSKRPRTRLSPLESLASTASNILSSQVYQGGSAAPPSRGAMSLASLISQPESYGSQPSEAGIRHRPASAAGREPPEHARVGRGSWPGAEPEDRDHFRRPTGPPFSSTHSGPAERGDPKGALPGQGGFPAAPDAEADGLGRRRGHRPPAVSTSATAAASVRPHTAAAPSLTTIEPLHRNSIGTIPSVLVGGAMEAEYAAQLARERDRELQRQRPPPHSSLNQRRESVTAGGPGSTPSTSTAPLPPPPQPSSVSSNTYYMRPNPPPPLGPPFGPQQPHPRALSFSALELQGPRGSIAAAMPAGPPRHLTSAHRIGAEPVTHRQPGAAVTGPPSSQHVLQSSYSMIHPAGYPPPPPSTSAYPAHVEPDFDSGASSKHAFLAPFSVFYDSLGDCRILATTLDGHIQRAGSLLHTLSSAEAALEALVDQRIDACRSELDSRWRHVEQRLRWLEDRLGTSGRGMATDSAVEDRLERLEESVARRGSGESDSASNADRRGSGGIGPRGAGRGSV